MEVSGIILQLAQQYPVLISILAAVGLLRAIMKPLLAAAHAYVEYTSDHADDAKLDEIEKSKFLKGFLFALDYVASIKIK